MASTKRMRRGLAIGRKRGKGKGTDAWTKAMSGPVRVRQATTEDKRKYNL